jgi:hypothetical protein
MSGALAMSKARECASTELILVAEASAGRIELAGRLRYAVPEAPEDTVIIDRRGFLRSTGYSAAALALSKRVRAAQVRSVEVTVDTSKALATMPQDFLGLSYESAQLADPAFFSSSNTTLVHAFRELSPHGVLRLGGTLSDMTLWKGEFGNSISPAEADIVRGRYEWRLVDQKAAGERPATLSPDGIASLAGFLRATGWKLLYGLNLGIGTPERAAEEASVVAKQVDDRLLAFQVGNEADLFGPSLRPQGWDFDRYFAQYQQFVNAVRARVPHAPFAGPDAAVKTEWVTEFAGHSKGDTVLISSHYYAMGPAGAPDIDAQRLLRNDPRLEREIPVLIAAGKTAGAPYRMTEGNTCFHGGQPGVSDAFASALWAADYLLHLAREGVAGVNLHGGGEGYYAPITGEPNATKLRPEYYGMRLAQQFAGATFVNAAANTDANVNAYAARLKGALLVAVVNKSSDSVDVVLHGGAPASKAAGCWRLTGPALDAKDGVQFAQATKDERRVDAYSAALWKF